MGETMYRIGDHVYVEAGVSLPYQIRRIDELNATANGTVNVVLSCFYRRSDVNPSLIEFADEGLDALVADDSLTPRQRADLSLREIFNSNMQETVDATVLRGKCCVIRVSDVESASSYLGKNDVFFFCYSYDPAEKSLCCDDGEIRVGKDYQVDSFPEIGGNNSRQPSDVETLIWAPGRLEDPEIEDYLKRCTTIGTLARTLNSCGALQSKSLLMSAASATRDCALIHALDTLHELDYDVTRAIKTILPSTGEAVITRDELECWSPQEAELFKEGMEKIGKDFYAIRQELLPWKSMKNLVEFYYMWKTTGGYDKTKTAKATEAKAKLVKILLPNIEKRPTNTKNNNTTPTKKCSICGSRTSVQYCTAQPFKGTDVCLPCWEHWKKYGVVKK